MPSRIDTKFYKEISQTTELVSESADEKFVWLQLYFDSDYAEDEKNKRAKIKNLIKVIRKMYDNMGDDSLFMVAFTGHDNRVDTVDRIHINDLNKGRCFLKYKCLEMEKLELETKELYEKVNNKNI